MTNALSAHDFRGVAARLPGEPLKGERLDVRSVRHVARVVASAVAAAVLVVPLAAVLLPAFAVGAIVYGYPPNVAHPADVLVSLRQVFTARPPPPGLGVLDRAALLVALLRTCCCVSIFGTAWLLDELLYGRELGAARVVAPFFEISAGRSGSTQIAHYLEADTARFVTVTFAQQMAPYVWLWKLAPHIAYRLATKQQLQRFFLSKLPLEMRERHEADLFAMDTFETSYVMLQGRFLGDVGPDNMREVFSQRPASARMRRFWCDRFVRYTDRVMRKALVYNGRGDGTRRVFVKGHFVGAAALLERTYHNAAFLTVLREPAPRLQSGINFLMATPNAPPWAWMAEALVYTERDYCVSEKEFYDAARRAPSRRCVVRFSDYVGDLHGTMQKIYRELFDAEVPASVPREHAKRKRTNYTVNRTLAELGISDAQLAADFKFFTDWMRTV